jgi:gamma-tubulin complex component 3
MLQRWIYEGELEDPHQEFFVICNEATADDGEIDIWRDRYIIQSSMIPEFIHSSLAHKALYYLRMINNGRY